MQVGTLAVQHIFEKDVHYRVPLYQRPYVWNADEQWGPLWEDLRALSESLADKRSTKAHFLGASVQDLVDVAPGHIETRLLIDGQQRLTTLQLLLKAFQHVVGERDNDTYLRALTKLVTNDHPLSTDDSENFKVWPTNADRADFEAVMAGATYSEVQSNLGLPPRKSKTGRSIPDGYFYFHKAISEWLSEGKGEEGHSKIAALYSTVRDNVRLVVIDLDDKDDAQMIFETLNARGTPLLAADLVKNSLLSDFADPKAAEKAYNKHWITFDQDATFWRAEVGRGHARRARLELFLRHALSILTRDDVAAAHLYDAYRKYADSPVAGTPIEQMEKIERYGKLYKRMITGWGDSEIDLYLERLSVMDYETVYPLLLVLFERLESEPQDLRQAVAMLDSFLVRRLVCRLNTRGYGRLRSRSLSTLRSISWALVFLISMVLWWFVSALLIQKSMLVSAWRRWSILYRIGGTIRSTSNGHLRCLQTMSTILELRLSHWSSPSSSMQIPTAARQPCKKRYWSFCVNSHAQMAN